jgi:hypothetical protein
MTETTLANLALGHIGMARIADLSENTVTAEHVRRMFDAVRDNLMRAYPWNFAVRRMQLTASATAPAFEYTYAYPLPSDCLRVLEINGCPPGVGSVPFEVEGAEVLTNLTTCKLRYLRRVEQVSLWDANFCEFFGYELAKAIAPSFTLQTSAIQMLDALAAPARARAEETNAAETMTRVIPYHERMDSYTSARYGAGFPNYPDPVNTEIYP